MWSYEILPGVPAHQMLEAIRAHLVQAGRTPADVADTVAAHPQTVNPTDLVVAVVQPD